MKPLQHFVDTKEILEALSFQLNPGESALIEEDGYIYVHFFDKVTHQYIKTLPAQLYRAAKDGEEAWYETFIPLVS